MKQASLAGTFYQADSGNVLIMSALMIPALLALTGVAVDFQFTVTQKSKMQSVLDSAVLAGAVQRQNGYSESDVTAKVKAYVEALSANVGGNINCDPTVVTYDTENEDILGSVHCIQPTIISSIIGHDEMEFTVGSTSTYGIGNIDVSFVFDVSGSMNSNNRLPLLKTAAKDAFDILLPDDQIRDGSVRLSIATYNHAVNAGPYFNAVTRERQFAPDTSNTQGRNRYNSHNDARLIDTATNKRYFYYEDSFCLNSRCDRYSDLGWNVARRPFAADIGANTCVAERVGTGAYNDSAPVTDNKVIAGNPRWNFYDSNRDKYNGEREVERGGANSYGTGAFTGRFSTCRPSGPVALTENKAALSAHVDALTADGGTAGHIGLAWGWYLISPNWTSVWPAVSQPWAYDEPDTAKAVILMTDGDFNTNHPSAADGSFAQAMQLCDEMKAAPSFIQVYTIGFQVPSSVQTTSEGQTILEYCASSPGHAFDADNGEELAAAYRSIARSISDLRLKN